MYIYNLDMLIFFDLSTGEQTKGFKVNPSVYKHSLSTSQNKIYHSTGKEVYEYDFSESTDTSPKEVCKVGKVKKYVRDIEFSSSENILSLEIVELGNNELVRLSLEKND